MGKKKNNQEIKSFDNPAWGLDYDEKIVAILNNNVVDEKSTHKANYELQVYKAERLERNLANNPFIQFTQDIENQAPEAYEKLEKAASESKSTVAKVVEAIVSMPSKIYKGLKYVAKKFVDGVKACYKKFMSMFKKRGGYQRLDNQEPDSVEVDPKNLDDISHVKEIPPSYDPPKYFPNKGTNNHSTSIDSTDYFQNFDADMPHKDEPNWPSAKQGVPKHDPPSYEEATRNFSKKANTTRKRDMSEEPKKWADKAKEKPTTRGRSNSL